MTCRLVCYFPFPRLIPAVLVAPIVRSQIDRATTKRGGSSMSIMKAVAMVAAAGGLCVVLALGAAAQEFNDKPLQDHWWPSEWGPDDKVGAPNRTTPEMVLKAAKLVKQGKVATLGKLYVADMPLSP